MTSPIPTTLILCGGSGERLGGIDKPLRPVAGKPLIEYVLAALAPAAGMLVISANRNADSYRRYATAIVDDGPYSGCGPLAGIAAGLAAARTEVVLCVPGDAPALPPDLLQ